MCENVFFYAKPIASQINDNCPLKYAKKTTCEKCCIIRVFLSVQTCHLYQVSEVGQSLIKMGTTGDHFGAPVFQRLMEVVTYAQ